MTIAVTVPPQELKAGKPVLAAVKVSGRFAPARDPSQPMTFHDAGKAGIVFTVNAEPPQRKSK